MQKYLTYEPYVLEYILTKNWSVYLEKYTQSKETSWSLYNLASGFLDASLNILTTNESPELFYKYGFQIYNKLTEQQKLVFDYIVCSGYNPYRVTKTLSFKSHNSTISHLKLIQKKITELLNNIPTPVPKEPKIIDTYLGKYEGESSAEWFERFNSDD